MQGVLVVEKEKRLNILLDKVVEQAIHRRGNLNDQYTF